MNKFLSKALSYINTLIALLIIFVPGIAAANYTGSPISFVMGCLFGLILAILICGTLALLINIRDEIVRLNSNLLALNK